MKNRGMNLHPYKLRGEWAELRFMTRAAEMGFRITKPWGDSASYDVIVEHEGRFARVQVKSCTHKRFSGYCCQVRGCQHRAYAENSFDFLAVYVIPEDVWYIIPEKRIRGRGNLYLRPRHRSKFNPYKEAWHLLRLQTAEEEIVDVIHACVADLSAEAAAWG